MRIVTTVTAKLAEDCNEAAAFAGYRSPSEWIGAVLAREVELFRWRERGAGVDPDPTPPPLGTTRPALTTMPPSSEEP